MPKKNIETPHKIISVTLLATGTMILATENRMYQLLNGVWTPMVFADEEPDPAPEAAPASEPTAPSDPAATAAPAATVAPPWSDPAAETTGETHS